jgi:hypothetical protein
MAVKIHHLGALLKVVYIFIEKILVKYTMPIKNWPSILAQLSIYYEDIVGKYL